MSDKNILAVGDGDDYQGSSAKKIPSYIHLLRGPLRTILVFTFFSYAFVGIISSVRLPFVRSLISCESTVSEEAIAANKSLYDAGGIYWSGSSYCDDKKYVVGEAVAITSIMEGYRLALRTLTLPLLGALIDSPYFGRRLTFNICMIGILILSVLFIFSKPIPQGVRADPFLIIANTAHGLLVEFGAVLNTMTADRTVLEERGHGFTLLFLANVVGSIVGSLITVIIERLFLLNYSAFWIGMALVIAFTGALSWMFIHETRPKLNDEQEDSDQPKEKKSIRTKIYDILKELEFIKNDYFLIIYTVGVFFALAGISIWGLLSSISIAAFNWKQGDFGIVAVTAGPIALLYLLFSPRAIKRFGAFPVFIVALGFMLITTVLVAISLVITSQIVFIFAIVAVLPVPVALPAANVIVSAKYEDKGSHGRAQGILSMAGALGSAVGIPLTGSVAYDATTTDPLKATLPFIISFCLLIVGMVFIHLSSKFYNTGNSKQEKSQVTTSNIISVAGMPKSSDTKMITQLNSSDI